MSPLDAITLQFPYLTRRRLEAMTLCAMRAQSAPRRDPGARGRWLKLAEDIATGMRPVEAAAYWAGLDRLIREA